MSLKRRLDKPYLWTVAVAGGAACVYSAYSLQTSQIDFQFLVIAFFTIIFGSRIGVQIPHVKAQVTVSDTFVFLVLVIYGGPAAVLLATAEALCSSMRFAGKWRTRFFNGGLLGLSTFVTAAVLKLYVGPTVLMTNASYSRTFIVAIFLMASVQYVVNSGLAAVREWFRLDEPLPEIWEKHFLWTSITYYAGASAAGIISKLINGLGFYALLITAPIVGVIYATYRTYRRNIAQAEKHASEQRRINEALAQSEAHFRNAFDHAAGMALITPEGHWQRVNESLLHILGYSEQEMLATNFQELTLPEDLGNDLVQFYQLLEGKIKIDQREKRYLHKIGHPVWVLQSASVARNAGGEPLHLVLQIQDITEKKRAEQQVHHAAFHDALTGLPNRSLLLDHLSLALARVARSKDYQFAVLFLDLDRFKMVNDSLGHSFGDQLLIELSRRLEQCMRATDTVARLGGDEFGMLLDGIKEPYEAICIAERVQELLRKPFDLNGHEFLTTVSIGIAFSQTGYEGPEEILRDADIAMYRAKTKGKARYEVFDAGMHEQAVEALTLERELRRAIENQEIDVYYQPIVSLTDMKVIGFEGLARWDSEILGRISPERFIPLAEETGLIINLGMLVLKKACSQVHDWHNRFPRNPKLSISVNLSTRQFRQLNLVEQVKSVLRETKLDASCLHLEVTESAIMENANDAAEMLAQLKHVGVKLSIDDFGTGYSSLNYLHRFPFDILKVDRSFVTRMGIDEESNGIIETILILAKKLKKETIAEGVETADQVRKLAGDGCDCAQGYLFSQPVVAAEAERLFLKTNEVDWTPAPIEDQQIDLDTHVYTM